MMEQGPVIIISFNAQQVGVVRDATGKVIEGNPVSVDDINNNNIIYLFIINMLMYMPGP